MTTPHTPPTQAELDARKKLCENTSPTWSEDGEDECVVTGNPCDPNARTVPVNWDDCLFMVAARTELPRLITEVERLRHQKYSPSSETIDSTILELTRLTKENERMREELYNWEKWFDDRTKSTLVVAKEALEKGLYDADSSREEINDACKNALAFIEKERFTRRKGSLTTENTEAHATIASLTTQLFAATKENEELRAILAVTETLSDPAMQKTKGEG